MALYDMTRISSDVPVTAGSLIEVPKTSFAREGIQERAHLQAALRDHIELVDPDLLVVAEEFGDFEGAHRRIDLLCLSRDGRLVVLELKRTVDGGHMDLQAIRYAAMVSTMTFQLLVRAFAKYRRDRTVAAASETDARSELLAWLEWDDENDPVLSREVGIVLVSEDFSPEITTTVLWLNEFHDFDIRCVRLSPYNHAGVLLLDVQQVIPLPEAADYMVRVRQKEQSLVRQTQGTANQDRTKFVVATPGGVSDPLPKRGAVLRLVQGLVESGLPISTIKDALESVPRATGKLIVVDGVFTDADELWDAVELQLDRSPENRKRWHLDDPIHDAGRTWILNNNWGIQTRDVFARLLSLAPVPGFAVEESA